METTIQYLEKPSMGHGWFLVIKQHKGTHLIGPYSSQAHAEQHLGYLKTIQIPFENEHQDGS